MTKEGIFAATTENNNWTKPETLSTILSLECTATYKPIIYLPYKSNERWYLWESEG